VRAVACSCKSVYPILHIDIPASDFSGVIDQAEIVSAVSLTARKSAYKLLPISVSIASHNGNDLTNGYSFDLLSLW
jgi:hypothetical protein